MSPGDPRPRVNASRYAEKEPALDAAVIPSDAFTNSSKQKVPMKKSLGVMALGLTLALAGTTASWAQSTGGAGGVGGPGNGQSTDSPSNPMKDNHSMGTSDSTMGSGSKTMMDKSAPAAGSQSSTPSDTR